MYEDPQGMTIARRIRDRLRRDAKHDYYGFPLGIMYATDAITLEEFVAAKSWAAHSWRLAQLDGLMLPKCRAINWEGRQGQLLLAEPSEDELKGIARLRASVWHLDNRISLAGTGALGVMRRLCLGDEDIGSAEQTLAKLAMVRLVRPQGIDTPTKIRYSPEIDAAHLASVPD